MPRRRSMLYAEAVSHLLRGAHRKDPGARTLPAPSTAEEALGWLALRLHGQERPHTQVRLMVRALGDAGELTAQLRHTWPDFERFLRDVAEMTGLLVPYPELPLATAYGFPHRSLREFLAAQALAEDISRHGLEEVPQSVLHRAVRGGAGRSPCRAPRGPWVRCSPTLPRSPPSGPRCWP